MPPTTKTALLSILAALTLLGAGCQKLPAGTFGPTPRSDWRDVVASRLAVVARNSGLEYRGTPIEFLNEPLACSAPTQPQYAQGTDSRDVGHCGDIRVTIYENGVPRERLFGFLLDGLPDGNVRFFVKD
jgi:hypothetical protein